MAGGVVTGVVIHSLGGGYKTGDVLTVARAGLEDYEGFGGGFALTVTSIAGLEGLTIAHSQDVVFGERVYMAGDVVINATGDVVFNDQVVLLRKNVDELAFGLVTPLQSDDAGAGHG